MIRVGTTFVFKQNVTPEQAAEALAKVIDVIDVKIDPAPADSVNERLSHFIHEFDDREGGPVWYIP